MKISFFREGGTFPTMKRDKIRDWVRQVAADYDKQIGEINYIFCSDEKILEINREYLQHDYYTDIITFDYSESNCISGDLFIGTETVKSNAEKFGTPYEEEFSRVIIHGVLHLCGQGDKTPEERSKMQQKEEQALKILTTL